MAVLFQFDGILPDGTAVRKKEKFRKVSFVFLPAHGKYSAVPVGVHSHLWYNTSELRRLS